MLKLIEFRKNSCSGNARFIQMIKIIQNEMIPKMTGLTMTAIKITKLRITIKNVKAANNLLILRWMVVHGNMIKLRASQEFQLAGFKPISLPTKSGQ
jgi:hypothetical protein